VVVGGRLGGRHRGVEVVHGGRQPVEFAVVADAAVLVQPVEGRFEGVQITGRLQTGRPMNFRRGLQAVLIAREEGERAFGDDVGRALQGVRFDADVALYLDAGEGFVERDHRRVAARASSAS